MEAFLVIHLDDHEDLTATEITWLVGESSDDIFIDSQQMFSSSSKQ